MTGGNDLEALLRELAPQVLAALVSRYGHFDLAEDAVQEALIAAAQQWPHQGLPGNPRRDSTDFFEGDIGISGQFQEHHLLVCERQACK